MPYESGMDPVHDTRRRFDVRFHLMAIAFLVFDVELLFLYPWAVAMRPAGAAGGRGAAAAAAAAAAAPGIDAAVGRRAGRQPRPGVRRGDGLRRPVGLGFVYDWRKGVFRWR